MFKKTALFFCLMLHWVIPTEVFATGDDKKILLHSDSLFTSFDDTRCFLHHVIEKGQTVYSISNFYGVKPAEVQTLNPKTKSGSAVGDIIIVPILKTAVVNQNSPDFLRWKWAPMYYKVTGKETLFRIGKMFGTNVDSLRVRNAIPASGIKTGTVLWVGWYSAYGPPKEAARPAKINDPNLQTLVSQNSAYKALFTTATSKKKPNDQRGPSIWMHSGKADLFVMHNEAAIGSTVMVYNPATKRRLYAKVIGRIPKGAYDPIIKIIISEPLGRYLGFVDDKVFVEIKYTL
jgi:LysM domain